MVFEIHLAGLIHGFQCLIDLTMHLAAAGAHRIHVNRNRRSVADGLVIAVFREGEAAVTIGDRRLRLDRAHRFLRFGQAGGRRRCGGGAGRMRVAVHGNADHRNQGDDHDYDDGADQCLLFTLFFGLLGFSAQAGLFLCPAL